MNYIKSEKKSFFKYTINFYCEQIPFLPLPFLLGLSHYLLRRGHWKDILVIKKNIFT